MSASPTCRDEREAVPAAARSEATRRRPASSTRSGGAAVGAHAPEVRVAVP